MPDTPIRLAIVGCGLAAERLHGPALRGFDGFAPVVMVDRDPARAAFLASYFDGATTEADYKQLAGKVDAAIVALPSHLNAPIAADLLAMGISVLVEKPAALTVADAQKLAAGEKAGGASCTVGFIRREASGIRFAKTVIDSGLLGDIRHFSIEDGYPFNWSGVSDFRFDRNRGGGIMLDIGTHVLDTAAYWFDGLSVTACRDDDAGGVETDVEIELAAAGGVTGRINLSWNRTLRNSAVIEGTKGTLEVQWYGNSAKLRLADGVHVFDGAVQSDARLTGGGEDFQAMFLAQLQRWYGMLASGDAAMAGSADALRNVELLDQCRAVRTPLAMPWRQVAGGRA